MIAPANLPDRLLSGGHSFVLAGIGRRRLDGGVPDAAVVNESVVAFGGDSDAALVAAAEDLRQMSIAN